MALLQAASITGYREFLFERYRWVVAIERAIARTPDAARVIGRRLIGKSELLARDLGALGMRRAEVAAIAMCDACPAQFSSVAEALGWLFTVERSTLVHNNVFHVLAMQHPGEMAFAASYLKCYSGSVGDSWRHFGSMLDQIAATDADVDELISAANAAFAAYARCLETDTSTLVSPKGICPTT